MKIGMRLGAALLPLALAAAVAVGTSGGGSATATTATTATPQTTRLVVRVDGCTRCTLTLARAFSGTDAYWRSRAQRVGSDHTAVFRVPTRKTRGLSFETHVPWEDYTGARLNVVTRYAGQRPGQVRNAREARAAQRAFGCWAGTRQASAHLHVHVAPYAFNGGRSTGAVAWASPGLASLAPKVRTWHGSIGNQEIFYCS